MSFLRERVAQEGIFRSLVRWSIHINDMLYLVEWSLSHSWFSHRDTKRIRSVTKPCPGWSCRISARYFFLALVQTWECFDFCMYLNCILLDDYVDLFLVVTHCWYGSSCGQNFQSCSFWIWIIPSFSIFHIYGSIYLESISRLMDLVSYTASYYIPLHMFDLMRTLFSTIYHCLQSLRGLFFLLPIIHEFL